MTETTPLWTVDESFDPPHLICPDGHRMQRDDFDVTGDDYAALCATVWEAMQRSGDAMYWRLAAQRAGAPEAEGNQ